MSAYSSAYPCVPRSTGGTLYCPSLPLSTLLVQRTLLYAYVRWSTLEHGCVHLRVPQTVPLRPFLCAQINNGNVAFMSGGALLLDDTSISNTDATTVCTYPWRAVQSHCALLRRVGDTSAPPCGLVRSSPWCWCGLFDRPWRWFSVRAVLWHAFCGGAWPGLVPWLGQRSETVVAARQRAALSIRAGAIDLAHSRVGISVRSTCSGTHTRRRPSPREG